MAFKLSPQHSVEIIIDPLAREQFLVLAIEACKQLNWNNGLTTANHFYSYTDSSMSSWGEIITVKIDGNKALLKSNCSGNQLVDWGKNKRNIELLTNKIDELKAGISVEQLNGLWQDLQPQLKSSEENDSIEKPITPRDQINGVISIFKPTQGYYITPILIILNLLVFLSMVISGVHILEPDVESLLKWGANYRPVTLEGQWWRILTACFLHIGILHLIMNMYALVYIGLLLEPLLGKFRFGLAYILTGIAASMASLWWHDNTVSAGASGAIFGMYGVFLAMLTTNYIEKSARKSLLTSIAIFVGFNLLNGIRGGIDNAAHIGGLLSGLIIGYAFIPGLKYPQNKILNRILHISIILLVITGSIFFYKTIPNDMGKYDSYMQDFSTNEELALGIYHMPENTSKASYLQAIKEEGIYNWKVNIGIINQAEKLDISQNLHDRNRLLLKYCELRISAYELIYKAIDEDTEQYQPTIDSIDLEIGAVIDELEAIQRN
jgi:rhomboid protease GluP